MNDEFSDEWKKNSDLISVVDALKNDFPFLDFQITRLLYILKSIDNKSQLILIILYILQLIKKKPLLN